MNGLINTKADYQVKVRANLGGIRVIMIVDKPSLTTWFGSNGKQDHMAANSKLNAILSQNEIQHIKELRTSERLQENTLYELTDVLAMS